ncbi:MAG: 16S rRNA methyltransferase [Thermoplasmatota archaeon]
MTSSRARGYDLMSPACNDTRMLHILLAEAELEMVPEEFWSHPAVVTNARKRKRKTSQVLLDSSLHYSLFKDPDERSRRGRPDIVHQFLLIGLDSILNHQGRLRLWIHTRNDQLITVDPTTRIPVNFNRFIGLFEELFRAGAVPNDDKPLIRLFEGFDYERSTSRIRGFSSDRGRDVHTVLLHVGGQRVETVNYFRDLDGRESLFNSDVLVTIGGFSHGDFKTRISSDDTISLHPDLLKVWTVETEVLVGFRQGRSGRLQTPC